VHLRLLSLAKLLGHIEVMLVISYLFLLYLIFLKDKLDMLILIVGMVLILMHDIIPCRGHVVAKQV
jgi:hypothetical protein